MEKIRKNSRKILGKLFNKPKNIEVIEKAIYNSVVDSNNIEEDYNNSLYEAMEYYNETKSIVDTFRYINNGETVWEHKNFDDLKIKQKEHDDFILNPFEVSEGVLECNNCGSKQTISSTKQTRSGDESMTVFAYCVKCNSSWKI